MFSSYDCTVSVRFQESAWNWISLVMDKEWQWIGKGKRRAILNCIWLWMFDYIIDFVSALCVYGYHEYIKYIVWGELKSVHCDSGLMYCLFYLVFSLESTCVTCRWFLHCHWFITAVIVISYNVLSMGLEPVTTKCCCVFYWDWREYMYQKFINKCQHVQSC